VGCPLLRIGFPTEFLHEMHVIYDAAAGEVTVSPLTLSSWLWP
jgi:hypothetical protein